jgi:RimJ/RimL family protein N-acetyltransferase
MESRHQTSGDVVARTVAVADGSTISIRPLTRGDRAGLIGLFSRLSADSRQRRFFTPKVELSERELAYFTDVDHVRHEALAAIDPWDGSIVGVARYVKYDSAAADVAIEVADDRQRAGIGTALAERLVDRARVNRVACLSATTRWDNRAARALLRRLGFRAKTSRGGELVLELDVSISENLSTRVAPQ